MKRLVASPFLIIGIVASLIVIFVAYFFFDFSRSRKNKGEFLPGIGAGENMAQQKMVQVSNVTGDDPTIVDVVEKVSEHIILPDGQVTVATVINADDLRKENPIFYRYAKQGDKVILYPDLAILYDPVLDRVLDIWHIVQQ